ncbi:hypothetical protein ACPCG0_09995 [Propionibacteriaceae bacterium Y1923]
MAFLARRRIDDPEAIEAFRIGFGDRTLSYRIPHPAPWTERGSGAGCGVGAEAGAQRLRQGDAMALEPHDHPDSPNQDWAEGVILRPGQRWSRRIEWHFDG